MTYKINQKTLDAIQAGQKIQAIKELRAFSGLGLKEAKDAVEDIASGAAYTVADAGGLSLFALVLENDKLDEISAAYYSVDQAGSLTFYRANQAAVLTYAAGVWKSVALAS